jgi:hypothetical protein
MSLNCANCRDEGRPAFTLAAYPSSGDDAVLVDFCSSTCLEQWTSNPEVEVEEALEVSKRANRTAL